MKTLKTDRLNLRALRDTDAGPLAQVSNDIEVARWLTRMPHPYRHKDAETFISGVLAEKRPVWAICLHKRPVGIIGKHGEFGYWLGRPLWGQGLMTEAARAVLLDHFAGGGGALLSGHHQGNHRSAKLLATLGFRYSGVTERVVCRATGADTLLLRMGLGSEDFALRRGRSKPT